MGRNHVNPLIAGLTSPNNKNVVATQVVGLCMWMAGGAADMHFVGGRRESDVARAQMSASERRVYTSPCTRAPRDCNGTPYAAQKKVCTELHRPEGFRMPPPMVRIEAIRLLSGDKPQMLRVRSWKSVVATCTRHPARRG